MAVETRRQVHSFEARHAAGTDLKGLLGGKGEGLARMTALGIPVPHGFTIDTTASHDFYTEGGRLPDAIWHQTREEVRVLEGKAGKRFGDSRNPLLVSVRSGAKFSMPGMMETVLNVGLNDQSVEGLAEATNNPRFAYDSYRRLIQMYGKTVMGVDSKRFDEALDHIKRDEGVTKDTDLTTQALRRTVTAFKTIVTEETGREFPQDPYQQLQESIGAVFNSWHGDNARAYRKKERIPDDLGTAVNVVQMVFGNTGPDSGTGVAFSRNPNTGEPGVYGDYLSNAQGEDVVAGIRTPDLIDSLADTFPEVYTQFLDIVKTLEKDGLDMQDIEFTIEHGKLWVLQRRAGKRTAQAAVRIATDLVGEGAIDQDQALQRVPTRQIEELLSPQFIEQEKKDAIAEGRRLTKGIAASPGAAVGEIVLDSKTAIKRAAQLAEEGLGRKIILVRPETAADDYAGMIESGGILTARGGKTSHAAVVARGAGIPAVVGASDIGEFDMENRTVTIGGKTIKEGTTISFDGTTGEVFLGAITRIEPQGLSDTRGLSELLNWADDRAKLEVWANADNPAQARLAREYGAKGIGLCRTEHMFNESDRIPIFRQMIMAAQDAKRYKDLLASGDDVPEEELQHIQEQRRIYKDSLEKLQEVQKGDFKGILKEMNDLPVIIRLLDPPLHEFLPNHTDLAVEVAVARAQGVSEVDLASKVQQLETVERLHEQDPMLGLRGVRLGIMYPEIYEMQVRAIIEAAAELKKEGGNPKPKIMIPLVSFEEELVLMRKRLEDVIKTTMEEQGMNVDYQIGIMIETPAAAVTAKKLAEHAEFFSFGTNDLTQTGLGISRDDADRSFLPEYVAQGIIPQSPFESIDTESVGRLVEMAFSGGRSTNPNLSIGICGEHGGEPRSIAFFNNVNGEGLNYVSASPRRIPVARLAAAQAVLNSNESTR